MYQVSRSFEGTHEQRRARNQADPGAIRLYPAWPGRSLGELAEQAVPKSIEERAVPGQQRRLRWLLRLFTTSCARWAWGQASRREKKL
jgi:hypothetical protein